MSQGIQFVSSNIIGYGPAEGKCFLCSGGSGRAVTISSYSSLRVPLVKNILTKSPVLVSKRTSSFVTNSSDNRRNPDFSKQNKQNNKQNTWLSKNRQNNNRDNFESHEYSELLSSENGTAFSTTPGPREKEIVELFRKVQAQLRERAALKEENKTEASEGQGHEDETVESLLKLLRKHSDEQGDRKSSSNNNTSSRPDSVIEQRDQNPPSYEEKVPGLLNSISNNNTGSRPDFVIEQRDQNAPSYEEKIPGLLNSNNSDRLEAQRTSPKPFKRPMSNFRRISPVPKVKFQPVYTAEDDIGSNSSLNSQGRRKTEVEPEPKPKPKLYPPLESQLDSDSESDDEDMLEFDDEEMLEPGAFSVSSNVNDEVFSETSEIESSDTDEADHDEVVETDSSTQQADLSELKLSDLRVLAKSRGLKGYSKMKKADLVELLSG